MMGAKWPQEPNETIVEKYAWLPVYSTFSKKRIWFKKYVEMDIYYDSEMANPIKSNTFKFVYTENEYLMYLLRKGDNNKHYHPQVNN